MEGKREMSLETYRAKLTAFLWRRPKLFRRSYRARLEAYVKELAEMNRKLSTTLEIYADENKFCPLFEKDIRVYSINHERAMGPARRMLDELNAYARLSNGGK
jgi:hypothetical protein